jgi:sarcosine oxidase, subunit beta
MFKKTKRIWDAPGQLKPHYDAVIIGGGLHGLATAYYLATRHGMRDIAIIEKRYIGFGGAGRNTAIVRANQRTAENVPLYKEALNLWPALTRELDFNLMFYNCGNLNLAHSEAALKAMRLQTATAQFHGVESHLVSPAECKALIPALDISDRPKYPIFGGMFHPPGGIVRHDAVVWGLAGGAAAKGVHIHQGTEVTGIGTQKGKIASVQTTRGRISTPRVLNAAGAYAAAVAGHLMGMRLPISVLTIQAMVTQPLKPLLDHVVSSGGYHIYANQTLKGRSPPAPTWTVGPTTPPRRQRITSSTRPRH